MLRREEQRIVEKGRTMYCVNGKNNVLWNTGEPRNEKKGRTTSCGNGKSNLMW